MIQLRMGLAARQYSPVAARAKHLNEAAPLTSAAKWRLGGYRPWRKTGYAES